MGEWGRVCSKVARFRVDQRIAPMELVIASRASADILQAVFISHRGGVSSVFLTALVTSRARAGKVDWKTHFAKRAYACASLVSTSTQTANAIFLQPISWVVSVWQI